MAGMETHDDATRQRLSRGLAIAIETLVLTLVAVAPWAFGAWEPFDFYFYCGIGVLLVLWAARVLVDWRFRWHPCPFALGLAALFLVGVPQLVPLDSETLRSVGPATTELYSSLLPATPEKLPFDQIRETTNPPAGRTLSVYPAATKLQLAQILALFLFFAAVRNNCASAAALRRLSIVALVNGSLLALLGLLQFLTSDLHHLYWTLKAPHNGTVFGPFLCRSHFSFYVNMCMGLGLGLLFSLRYHHQGYIPETWTSWSQRRMGMDDNPYELTHPPLLMRSWTEILHDSRVFWILFPLCLMASSVVCSLSRGGLLTLVFGVVLGLVLGVPRQRRWLGFVFVLMMLAGVLLLFTWFSFDILETRHATILSGELLSDRWDLWRGCLPLIRHYFWTGTGYGTFQAVEPLYREAGIDSYLLSTHAHNEYLEALVEGGLARLLVTLGLVAAVFYLALRAVRRTASRSAQGLAMGAFTALLMVMIHSGAEFGIHVPAIALLAAAIAAQLSAVALDPDPTRPRSAPPDADAVEPYSLGGVAPPVLAVVLIALAVVVVAGAWRNSAVFRLRLEAQRENRAIKDVLYDLDSEALVKIPVAAMEQKVAQLRRAAQLAPDFAVVRLQLANALFQLVKAQQQESERNTTLAQVSALVLGGAHAALHPATLGEAQDLLAFSGLTASGPLRLELNAALLENAKPLIAEQLNHLLVARDLCPVNAIPHLRIAENINNFASAEPRSAYLGRAKRLRDFDANLWFDCGNQEYLDGNYDEAIKSWRTCLERKNLADRDANLMFAAILLQAQRQLPVAGVIEDSPPKPLLGPTVILDRVIPDRPALILRAVQELLGKDADRETRRPYLEKALRLLGQPTKAEDLHLQGLICLSLGKDREAEAALAKAVTLRPNELEWRLELAKLYFDMKRYQDCILHLDIVQQGKPSNPKLKAMLEAARDLRRQQEANPNPKP